MVQKTRNGKYVPHQHAGVRAARSVLYSSSYGARPTVPNIADARSARAPTLAAMRGELGCAPAGDGIIPPESRLYQPKAGEHTTEPRRSVFLLHPWRALEAPCWPAAQTASTSSVRPRSPVSQAAPQLAARSCRTTLLASWPSSRRSPSQTPLGARRRHDVDGVDDECAASCRRFKSVSEGRTLRRYIGYGLPGLSSSVRSIAPIVKPCSMARCRRRAIEHGAPREHSTYHERPHVREGTQLLPTHDLRRGYR